MDRKWNCGSYYLTYINYFTITGFSGQSYNYNDRNMLVIVLPMFLPFNIAVTNNPSVYLSYNLIVLVIQIRKDNQNYNYDIFNDNFRMVLRSFLY